MILLVGSIILALLNCVSLYLISHHRARLGWTMTLILQVLWIPYDIFTGQWGFLLISALTIGISIKSWGKVKEAQEKTCSQGCGTSP